MSDQTQTTDLVQADLDARAAAVERQVAEATERAEAMQVTNQAEAEAAGQLLREIAARKKAVEDDRKKLKEPVLEAGRRIDGQAKAATASLDAVDAIVRPKLVDYNAEQERIRREAQQRLEAETRERERKEREAREQREAEERAKREQAQREAREAEEEAQAAKDAEDRAAAEALASEARMKAEEAEIAEQAIAAEPEIVAHAVVEQAPKQEGIATRKEWKGEVVDRAAVPAQYWVLDEKALQRDIRAGAREIPGVRIYSVDRLAVRS